MSYAQFVTQRRLRRISESPAAFQWITGQPSSMPGMTFTRASVALYQDAAGVYQSAAVNTLRTGHYINGVNYTLREGAATNLLTYGRDLSNVAWTATDVTVAATTGADGTAASASRLTATGANGTVIRAAALVHGSAAYAGSFVAKRITGTGNIQLTLDNGSTWTTVTLTAAYTQLFTTQTLANSQFGIRLVTSGDVIDVDFCQDETGAVPSSPIATAAAAVTRAADLWSFAWARNPEAGTWYADIYNLGVAGISLARVIHVGAAGNPRFLLMGSNTSAGNFQVRHAAAAGDVSSDGTAVPAFGARVELRPVLYTGGEVKENQSINSGAESSGALSASRPFTGAWGGALYIGTDAAGNNPGNLAIRSILYVPVANYPMADFRNLVNNT